MKFKVNDRVFIARWVGTPDIDFEVGDEGYITECKGMNEWANNELVETYKLYVPLLNIEGTFRADELELLCNSIGIDELI